MEEEAETLLACWSALGAVVASIPKEVAPSYVRCMRDAVQNARDKERRKRKPGPLLLPGFCLPKALQPMLPIYLQARQLLVHRSAICPSLSCKCVMECNLRCTPLGDVRQCARAFFQLSCMHALCMWDGCQGSMLRPSVDGRACCKGHRQSCARLQRRAWASWWRSPARRRCAPSPSRSLVRCISSLFVTQALLLHWVGSIR